MGKRELVALLILSSWCLLMVQWLFLAVLWGCLRILIVVFPDHTHLLFLNKPRIWVPRFSSDQEIHAVEVNIQKAQRTMYSLMGLHGENGLDPETAVSLLQKFVFPVLPRGCLWFVVVVFPMEVIIPTGKALNQLEVQQKKKLKQVLSLSTNVADPAVYIISGTHPMEAMIHKRILKLFGNINRLTENVIEYNLAKRQ